MTNRIILSKNDAMKNEIKKLGLIIKKNRIESGISKRSFARICELNEARLSRIEAGQTNLKILTLQKISKALGIKLADFFTS